MSQTSVIVASLLGAFVLYIIARGQLPAYLGALLPSTGATSTGSAAPAAAGAALGAASSAADVTKALSQSGIL